MSGSQGAGGDADTGPLWTPAPEIAAEVTAAVAEAGEVAAEEPEDLDEFEDFGTAVGETTQESESIPDGATGAAAGLGGIAAVAGELAGLIPEQDADTVAAPVPTPVAVPVAEPAVPVAGPAVPGSVAVPASAASTGAPPVFAAAPAAPDAPLTPIAPAATSAASGPGPEQVSRHIARAEALAELGRRQQALDVLNELIVAGAEDVRVWRALASVYLELGDGDKALRAADWVVTFEPHDEWGHRLRASALRLLDRPEEAVDAATEAVRLDPDVWQGHAALAMALHSTGDLSAAAAEARKATAMAAEQDPAIVPEVQQVEQVLQQAATSAEQQVAHSLAGGIEAGLEGGLDGLEAALSGRPGLDDESLSHVSGLVLRGLEFSAGAGWLVSFGGIAIPGFNIRFLIPLAVLAILGVFLFRPARKAGRDIWRYLAEYLWQDANTRYALLMALAAHVWMIAGSSVGHIQGGSALGVGLLTHLTGRTVLARKAPELNPVRRSGGGAVVAATPQAAE